MTTFSKKPIVLGIIKLVFLGVMVSGLAAYSGCATTYSSKSDEESTSTTTTFLGKNDGLLKEAREQRMAGNFSEAIRLFEQLAKHPSAKADMKAQALLGLGDTYSSLMNQQRDYAKAKDYYQKVITNYPDTPWQKDAQKGLETVESLLEK
jgi:outer membrane protein assembly factor BamD (BamD/ComL family)